MSLSVRVWGARGSLPRPHLPREIRDLVRQYQQSGAKLDAQALEQSFRQGAFGFGGNTPCVEVFAESKHLIIDAGSGIRELGYELMQGPCGQGQGEVHLFFTHFHWDHILGLPFFVPIFVPGNTIHLYAVEPTVQTLITHLFQKPYFPVTDQALGAKIEVHLLQPRVPMSLGDMSITPYQLDHPDPCWGYRIESGGRVYAHCVDTEGVRVSRADLGPDLPLYQGVNLMIFDAQYTLAESMERVDWGHSSALVGLDLAIQEQVEKVVFMHFDPAATDAKIALARTDAERYLESQVKSAKRSGAPLSQVPQFEFAIEGETYQV